MLRRKPIQTHLFACPAHSLSQVIMASFLNRVVVGPTLNGVLCNMSAWPYLRRFVITFTPMLNAEYLGL
jgi:hypothetical protein